MLAYAVFLALLLGSSPLSSLKGLFGYLMAILLPMSIFAGTRSVFGLSQRSARDLRAICARRAGSMMGYVRAFFGHIGP